MGAPLMPSERPGGLGRPAAPGARGEPLSGPPNRPRGRGSPQAADRANVPPSKAVGKRVRAMKERCRMSAQEVDHYLSEIEEPKRTTLQKVRRSILAVVPDAEEGISYGMPAFRVNGKV